jgi:alpha-D-ribose 1-methylphosphonate 5-triphosphate synthase subunit PhnG
MKNTPETTDRAAWIGQLARAKPERLRALFPALPPYEVLRPAEIGTVMVQGRAGGTGAPFNLGEITVTRCALRLTTGEVGHGHVHGRDKDHATRAAILDALLQTDQSSVLRAVVLAPLAADEAAHRAARAAKAAATKVEFFTLVRGEDK